MAGMCARAAFVGPCAVSVGLASDSRHVGRGKLLSDFEDVNNSLILDPKSPSEISLNHPSMRLFLSSAFSLFVIAEALAGDSERSGKSAPVTGRARLQRVS